MYLNHKKQQGSALVIAVFIIIVMLALVLSLSRLLISGNETLVYEVQGTRALFAAQSGLELTLPKIFPLGASTVSACPAGFSNPIIFNTDALKGCRALVSCSLFSSADPALNQPEVYRLISQGWCVANEFTTSRTVQVEVRK